MTDTITVKCPRPECGKSITTANRHAITEWLGLHTCTDQCPDTDCKNSECISGNHWWD